MQNGKDSHSGALTPTSPSPFEMKLAPQASANDAGFSYAREREEESGAQRWQRLMALLKRRRKIAALIFGSVLGLAALYMTLAPRIYRAKADVLINSDKSPMSQLTDKLPALGDALGSTGARSQETEVEILNSASVRDLAEKMMPLPERKGIRKDLVVSIRPIRQTDIISVYVSGRSPQQARKYANTICAAYLKQNQEANSAQYGGSADFVGTQLATVRKRLDQQRRAVRDYKDRNNITDLSAEGEARLKAIGDLTVQLQGAKAEGASAAARLQQLKSQISAIPKEQESERTITERPIVAQLKEQLTALEGRLITARQEFTELSPEVSELKGQIASLQNRLRSEAATEVTGKRVQINPLQLSVLQAISQSQAEVWSSQASATALQNQLTALQQGLKVLPDREYHLSQLQAELVLTQTLYMSLAEKFQTLTISKQAPMTNARVISPADDADLVSPRLAPTIALALLLGALCAIGGAALLDRVDDRIYSEEDARHVSGLPILAQIPLTRGKGNPLLNAEEPQPVLLENFRMLRTQLVLSMPNAKHCAISITSSQPHEGKSTVAANLALALALNGKRVILLDADLRRPQGHAIFDVPNANGFSSVVAGIATLDEALVQIADNLQLMPAGPMPPNPPEMLDSPGARALIQTLQERCDILLIDTPPTPFMADAQIVATMVSGVIFVLSTKDARRYGVERSLELLESTGTRLLGIVLNKQDAESSVYYSDYRYKAYLAGPSA